MPSTAIASTALSARTAEQLPDNTPRTTEEHSVTFVMLALERRPFGRRFGAMEMALDHRRPVLQADLPLRTKLVLLPPGACEQEPADKNTPVDVPAPTITYPVAHRQSS